MLVLAREYPPQGSTGVASHVSGLSRALGRAGHDVTVFVPAGNDDRSAEAHRRLDDAHEGVRVRRAATDLPWLPDDDVVANTASINNHLVALLGELGDWRPDLVHAHDWDVAWAARTIATVHRCPLVATIHATERSRHGGHLPPGAPEAIHAVESWLVWTADRVVCTSRFMLREVSEGFEYDASAIDLVPSGIDPSDWSPPNANDERGPLVVAWGRVQYEKGFQVLAQAMARLRGRIPGLSCLVAGRGSYLPELQSQVDLEGVSDIVQLAGFVPNDELRQLLHRAGCVVIPSLYEPFGVVALEALASGAPVVAARTGGLAEIMDGTGAAAMFEPGNAIELAERIGSVLQDPLAATGLTESARRLLAERYSWDAIAASTLEVYGRLVG